MHNNNGNAHCTNSVTVDEQELLNEVKAYLLTAIEDKKAFADKIENDFPYVINDEAIYRYKKSVCDDISNK